MKKLIVIFVVFVSVAFLFFIALAKRQENPYQNYLKDRRNAQNSIVVIKNESNCLPITKIDKHSFASLNLGETNQNEFTQRLDKYAKIDHFSLGFNQKKEDIEQLVKKLKKYNTVFISFYADEANQKNGISKKWISLFKLIGKNSKIVFTLFGDNKLILDFGNLSNYQAVILAQKTNSLNQELSAEIIFGGTKAIGKLKDSINEYYVQGFGIELNKQTRFSYSIPEDANLNSEFLNRKIDSIATLAIEKGAFPGCQVLVAKDMKVVLHKTYGFHTYENLQKVMPTDVYDLASVTKLAAGTMALMKLYDNKIIDLDAKFSDTWTDWKDSDKKDLNWRELLTHQAGLKAWIPFWTEMFDSEGNPKPEFIQKDSTTLFSYRINDSLFIRNDYKKDVYRRIKEAELSKERKYLYSCLSFYLYPEIVKNLTNIEFEEFLNQNYYRPLGINSLKYNAYKYFPLKQIIPTEVDTFFRKTLIHGKVHDEGAIVMSGLSANAGLFGSANDLAILMQMLANMGTYGDEQYLNEATVKEFIRVQFPENGNRRGLGFDKPLFGNDTLSLQKSYPAPSVSANSFGHSGFTGTFIWADPDANIVFIFLSNRVFPTRKNSQIYNLNVRTSMQQAIYDSRMKN
jgi:CubicO group peptidase (beta-lactamase class C family)